MTGKKMVTIKLDDETVTVFQFGENEYSVEYSIADYSLRGNIGEIIVDILSYVSVNGITNFSAE